MAVVAFVVIIIPFARDYSPESEINKATAAMADDLRQARSQSVKYGNDVIVTIDVIAGVVKVYNDVTNNGPFLSELIRSNVLSNYGVGAFGSVVTTGIDGAQIAAPVVMGATVNPFTVTFHANGSATNSGVIYLTHKRNGSLLLGRAISILGTGTIQTWKYHAYGSPGPWIRWI